MAHVDVIAPAFDLITQCASFLSACFIVDSLGHRAYESFRFFVPARHNYVALLAVFRCWKRSMPNRLEVPEGLYFGDGARTWQEHAQNVIDAVLSRINTRGGSTAVSRVSTLSDVFQ